MASVAIPCGLTAACLSTTAVGASASASASVSAASLRGDHPACIFPSSRVKAQSYTRGEWDGMEPTLRRLYLEKCMPLRVVAGLMAREFDFHATDKMYKANFKRWGWQKNRPRPRGGQDADANVKAGLSISSGESSPASSVTALVRHIKTRPQDSDLPFFYSRVYTKAQFESHDWGFGPYTLGRKGGRGMDRSDSDSPGSSPSPSSRATPTPDFHTSEILLLYCIHNIRQGRVALAFGSLNGLFNILLTSWRSLHPKLVVGHWSLLRKIHDMCIMAKDLELALLRELIRYLGRPAQDYLQRRPSSTDPVPNMLVWMARLWRESPGFLHHTIHKGMITAATALEETMGLDHPVVLLAWSNIYWYGMPSAVASKQIAERFEALLSRAEAVFGPDAPVTIGILYDLTNFSVLQDVDRQRQAELGAKLLDSTTAYISRGPPDEQSQVPRACALGTLVLGLFALEDNDPLGCEAYFAAAADWFSTGGELSRMLREMLLADRDMLVETWRGGGEMRELELNFLRPRCFDLEREGAWTDTVAVGCIEGAA